MKLKKPLGEEVIDQAAHLIVAYVLVIIVHPASIGQAAILGLLAGLIREVTEGGEIWSSGSLRDLFFWTLGGLCGGLFYA